VRVIDCECGSTIKAASDEELTSELREHMEEEHPGDELSDERLDQMVAERAYDAEDA
jgi:predicted small metal-binding protein